MMTALLLRYSNDIHNKQWNAVLVLSSCGTWNILGKPVLFLVYLLLHFHFNIIELRATSLYCKHKNSFFRLTEVITLVDCILQQLVSLFL